MAYRWSLHARVLNQGNGHVLDVDHVVNSIKIDGDHAGEAVRVGVLKDHPRGVFKRALDTKGWLTLKVDSRVKIAYWDRAVSLPSERARVCMCEAIGGRLQPAGSCQVNERGTIDLKGHEHLSRDSITIGERSVIPLCFLVDDMEIGSKIEIQVAISSPIDDELAHELFPSQLWRTLQMKFRKPQIRSVVRFWAELISHVPSTGFDHGEFGSQRPI